MILVSVGIVNLYPRSECNVL